MNPNIKTTKVFMELDPTVVLKCFTNIKLTDIKDKNIINSILTASVSYINENIITKDVNKFIIDNLGYINPTTNETTYTNTGKLKSVEDLFINPLAFKELSLLKMYFIFFPNKLLIAKQYLIRHNATLVVYKLINRMDFICTKHNIMFYNHVDALFTKHKNIQLLDKNSIKNIITNTTERHKLGECTNRDFDTSYKIILNTNDIVNIDEINYLDIIYYVHNSQL